MTGLELFTHTTRDAAINGFAGRGTPVEYCDGQFAICGDAILLFAALGTTTAETHLNAPDRLEWRPARNDYHPEEKIPWLPEAVIPRYDRERKRWLQHTHVFLRGTADDGNWLYCGTAHLGSYGAAQVKMPPGPGGPANYSFDAGRMPREHWLALGGYPGWEATVEGQSYRLAAGDQTGIRALLQSLEGKDKTHVQITRWEGDAFSLNLNRERGFPMYLRDPYDSGLYVVLDTDEPAGDEVFACGCCGIPLEAPRRSTLPRPAALALLVKFFVSGTPPKAGDAVKLGRGVSAPEWQAELYSARWSDRLP